MKFYVMWSEPAKAWRWSNLRNIGGYADTWAQAFDEAFDLATLSRPKQMS